MIFRIIFSCRRAPRTRWWELTEKSRVGKMIRAAALQPRFVGGALAAMRPVRRTPNHPSNWQQRRRAALALANTNMYKKRASLFPPGEAMPPSLARPRGAAFSLGRSSWTARAAATAKVRHFRGSLARARPELVWPPADLQMEEPWEGAPRAVCRGGLYALLGGVCAHPARCRRISGSFLAPERLRVPARDAPELRWHSKSRWMLAARSVGCRPGL